jgi:putative endonuclease
MQVLLQKLQRLFQRPANLQQQRGFRGERAAARFLKKAGYRILDTNWRAGHYELDIVAQQAACVVFVEVRGRCIQCLQSGFDSVNRKKKQALQTAIRAYLKTHHCPHYRLDIISIDWDSNGRILAIHHYENIPCDHVRR